MGIRRTQRQARELRESIKKLADKKEFTLQEIADILKLKGRQEVWYYLKRIKQK